MERNSNKFNLGLLAFSVFVGGLTYCSPYAVFVLPFIVIAFCFDHCLTFIKTEEDTKYKNHVAESLDELLVMLNDQKATLEQYKTRIQACEISKGITRYQSP